MKKVVLMATLAVCLGVRAGAADAEDAVTGRFPLIYQEPELPTGCEITAMTMVLNYYGYDVDKVTMALEYLPMMEAEWYFEDGILYGNDMENYFIGDPFTEEGYICGPGAIIEAANAYLEDVGSSLRAQNLTRASTEALYKMAQEGIPVVVWGTIGMEDRAETDGWYREDGIYMEWSSNDHGSVLIDALEDTVVIADPIEGIIEVEKEQFEKIFKERGSKCVVVL